MRERLQKALARSGVASRRKSEELIAAGKVKVNGKIVTEMGTQVDLEHDKVSVDGKPIVNQQHKVYILLYKPKGIVSTVYDPRGRKTVVDWLPSMPERIYPVGRLDYNTEGLLLLTNDGSLTYGLTHPKHNITKIYRTMVQGIPTDEQLKQLANGVELEDGITAPSIVGLVDKQQGNAVLEIHIHEGRNRQIRRMCEAIGHPVLKLKRTTFAFLTLKGLGRGQHRELTKDEVRGLYQLISGKTRE